MKYQAMKYQLHAVEHSRPLTPEGHYPSFLVDLAAFLLVRGPFAWLGTDCESAPVMDASKKQYHSHCSLARSLAGQFCGDQYDRPVAMDTDYVRASACFR
jgi:hypothetical protein